MADVGLQSARVLARIPLFADVLPADLERLGDCLRSRRYERDEIIFLEGDTGTALGVIASGRVRISLSGSDGREVTLNVYGPGEFFGEFALLDGEPRSADAVALEPSHLYWLRRDDFLAFVEAHPRAAIGLLTVLSRRLRHTTRIVQDTAFLNVPARLARVLLSLADGQGRPGSEGVLIDIRLTQSDLAAMVGASRETVNRALRTFERLGFVKHDRGMLTIVQPEQLRRRDAAV